MTAVSQRGDPLRVVVFTGGAVLERGCAEFLRRIEARPELELAGVFVETRARGLAGLMAELWRRRRLLAPLLFIQHLLRRVTRWAASPVAEYRRQRALRRLADRTCFTPDLHHPGMVARVAALAPDAAAVYGGPILRPALFDIPVQGTIGIHHGTLPAYRGKKTTFWAMYHGEPQVGVAIQRIGTGLDRGDLLRYRTLPVGRKPLPRVVRELEELGVELFIEGLLSIRDGSAAYLPQPAGGGPMYKDPRLADIVRFWARYAARMLRTRPAQ